MKFSLPSKSTLSSLASIKKPPITSLLKVGAMMTPMGMVGVGAMTLGGLVLTHKDEIKSTLGHLGHEVKKDVAVVGNTLEKGAVAVGHGVEKVGHGVASGLQTLMMPVMVIGSLVVVMMILKK